MELRPVLDVHGHVLRPDDVEVIGEKGNPARIAPLEAHAIDESDAFREKSRGVDEVRAEIDALNRAVERGCEISSWAAKARAQVRNHRIRSERAERGEHHGRLPASEMELI
jgi:hypothetical protein